MAPKDPVYRRQFWQGVGILLAGYMVGLVIWAIYEPMDGWFMGLILVGFWQWLFVIPAAIITESVLKRPGMTQGLLIGAGVTLLLSFVACGGLVFGILPLVG